MMWAVASEGFPEDRTTHYDLVNASGNTCNGRYKHEQTNKQAHKQTVDFLDSLLRWRVKVINF